MSASYGHGTASPGHAAGSADTESAAGPAGAEDTGEPGTASDEAGAKQAVIEVATRQGPAGQPCAPYLAPQLGQPGKRWLWLTGYVVAGVLLAAARGSDAGLGPVRRPARDNDRHRSDRSAWIIHAFGNPAGTYHCEVWTIMTWNKNLLTDIR